MKTELNLNQINCSQPFNQWAIQGSESTKSLAISRREAGRNNESPHCLPSPWLNHQHAVLCFKRAAEEISSFTSFLYRTERVVGVFMYLKWKEGSRTSLSHKTVLLLLSTSSGQRQVLNHCGQVGNCLFPSPNISIFSSFQLNFRTSSCVFTSSSASKLIWV